MAYGYPEFPHVNYETTDLMELISLYEQVKNAYDGTYKEITKLSERLDAYEKSVESRLEEKARSAVEQLKVQTENTLRAYKEETTQRLDSKFYNYEQEVNSEVLHRIETNNNEHIVEIDRVKRSISEYQTNITQTVADFKTEILSNVSGKTKEYYEYMLTYVENVSKNLLNSIEEVKETFNTENLWQNVYSINGFSALEWYEFPEITCEDWNNSGITCAQWYVNGKEIFNYWEERQKMLSPISGDMELPRDVLSKFIFAMRPQGLTARDYEDLHLTADMYDKLMLSASEYDLKGETNVFSRNTKFKTSTVQPWRPPRFSW